VRDVRGDAARGERPGMTSAGIGAQPENSSPLEKKKKKKIRSAGSSGDRRAPAAFIEGWSLGVVEIARGERRARDPPWADRPR